MRLKKFFQEFGLVFLISLLVIFLTSISLIYGWKITPSGMEFLGRRYLNSQDTYTYFAFIEQAKQGRILVKNLFTPEEHPAFYFRPVYFLIGKVAQIVDLSNIFAFHFFRIIFGFGFLFLAYWFISLFFSQKQDRILAFLLLGFSGGIGFLVSRFFPNSTDLWIPESITFLSLADSPHFILSQALMIGIFGLFLLSVLRKRLIFVGLAGILGLVLSIEHPFDLPVIYLTLLLYLATVFLKEKKIPWQLVVKVFLVLLPSLFGIGYYFWILKNFPVATAWHQQNQMFSPNIVSWLAGFGLLIPLATLGLIPALEKKEEKGLVLLAWIGATSVLLYSPFNVQRRFINGVHIPLVILATFGLLIILARIEKFFQKLDWNTSLWKIIFLSILILFLFGSNGYSIYQDIAAFRKDTSESYYYYFLEDERQAIEWLKEHSNPDDIIAANWFYGNLIPGMIGRWVFLGHKVQTIDFDKKASLLEDYVNKLTDEEGEEFLKEWGIDYLFFGKDDSLLQGGFNPLVKEYLQEDYARFVLGKKIIQIYKLK